MITDAHQKVSSCVQRLACQRLYTLALALTLTPLCASAAEFVLMPSPQTVHIGHFNAALKPELELVTP